MYPCQRTPMGNPSKKALYSRYLWVHPNCPLINIKTMIRSCWVLRNFLLAPVEVFLVYRKLHAMSLVKIPGSREKTPAGHGTLGGVTGCSGLSVLLLMATRNPKQPPGMVLKPG